MRKQSLIDKRIIFIGLSITLLFLALDVRLGYIQIIKGREYAEKALQQRTLAISIEKVRGDILDRNGIPFTKGKERSYLLLFPGIFHDNGSTLDKIRSMTGMTEEYINKIMNMNTPYIKREIIRSIPQLEIEIEEGRYPGVMMVRERARYDSDSLARHVIGYLKKSDQTPVIGIEKEFDEYLHSNDSVMMYAFTDARHNVIPGVGFKVLDNSSPCYDVQLTLDYYIQEILEDALEHHGGKGGGVVVDATTGDILALASRPHFDQNNIYASTQQDDCFWSVPMTAFPPGSVFKTVVAAAALEEGTYHGSTSHICNGEITINGVRYSCHPAIGGLGDITIREAFAHSCNDAFIKMGMDIGGARVVEMAEKLGFGDALNLGLENQAGSLPDKWEYAGAGIGNLAIGQGKVEATPLQIANMISIIANDGIKKELGLIKNILTKNGQVIQQFREEEKNQRVLDPTICRELRQWMEDVTDYGTGMNAYSGKVGGTGGKTGTPQVAGDPNAKYYGWFSGFFPLEKPQYVIVILNREEENGGKKAAKIFKEVAEGIFEYKEKLQVP